MLHPAAVTRRATVSGGKESIGSAYRPAVLTDVCNQYLAKGQVVYVEGRLKSHSYEGRDGATRFQMEITSTDVQFLGRAGLHLIRRTVTILGNVSSSSIPAR